MIFGKYFGNFQIYDFDSFVNLRIVIYLVFIIHFSQHLSTGEKILIRQQHIYAKKNQLPYSITTTIKYIMLLNFKFL